MLRSGVDRETRLQALYRLKDADAETANGVLTDIDRLDASAQPDAMEFLAPGDKDRAKFVK